MPNELIMNEKEKANTDLELRRAREMQSVYFILMLIFFFFAVGWTMFISSSHGENISTIGRQSAQIAQLTIERDVLLKVQCVEESDESDDEAAPETVNNRVNQF